MTDAIVQGILLGGLYALFAAGLAIVFGVMKIVNLAHGDFIILSAYLTLVAVELTSLNPMVTVALIAAIMGIFGYALQRGILNFTLGSGILPPLVVTFGLSIIIQNVLLEVFSADTQGLDAGALELSSMSLPFGIAVGWFPFLTFLLAIAVLGGLQLVIGHTKMGRSFRAVSDDEETASLMGVRTRHVFGMAMAIALVVTAIGGVVLGIRTQFDPALGPARLIYAFETVIIGGLGSLWGTLVGGVVLGVAQNVGAYFSPGWRELAGHLVFLIVLAWRPSGLFGRNGE
ncbi:MAG: branched-chain amino acid ABC transporter permease [Acidimicrobiia bacterium]